MKCLFVAASLVLSAVMATQVPIASSRHAQAVDPLSDSAKEKAAPAKPDDKNIEKLRAELVALTKERAEVMKEGELASAIALARTLNQHTRAQRELERVYANLNEITEKYPKTPAAEAAKKLGTTLQVPTVELVIRFHTVNTAPVGAGDLFGEPRAPLEPEPDDLFKTPSPKRGKGRSVVAEPRKRAKSSDEDIFKVNEN